MNQLRKISAKYLFEEAKKGFYQYERIEKESILYVLFEDMFHISKIDFLADKEIIWNTDNQHILEDALQKLNNHVPVQYVIGRSFFYKYYFKLNADTLIPRPETEELVQLIITENTHPSPSIIDIGTGSGCIAICLAANMPNARTSAVDISASALDIARTNAEDNQAKVNFIELDFLSNQRNDIPDTFDIIVSNPPYVLESEKEQMRENVLAHEPHLALFVNDQNALVYYDALLSFAEKTLNKNGYVYAEINEQKGAEMKSLALQYGFTNISIIKDLFNKDRIFKAQKV
ncbi:peptide chain release factor N(5)-glutamine methyltransferase [Cytophaga aurantiaca]|uniref:peptide chain release factor N(5)-glutamine methyltransferase n=1 Tax=Cytophaga aurantiaca TaxID=29530 RepID=UPI0003733497|nr:peptide chain release factor N(5)-glutamine methyltransferase [Cytophaga aurantiaca]